MRALLALLVLLPAPACPTAPVRNPSRFLYLSVLEGLYEEGFDPKRAAALVAAPDPGHFVVKCPICEPVRFGFEVYAAHPVPRMYDFKEDATPPELLEGLKSPERPRRMAALKALVDRYVSRKLSRSALTDAERAAFSAWAEDARKKGMTMKPGGFGDFCPSCDGACRPK